MFKKVIKHTFIYECVGVLLLFMVLLYLVALYSFDVADSAWMSQSYPVVDVGNKMGRLGARISSFSIYFLGLLSYFLLIPSVFVAIFFFRLDKDLLALLRQLLACSCLFISMVFFLEYIYPLSLLGGIELVSSGVLGAYIVFSVVDLLGQNGAALCAGMCFILSVILFSRKAIVLYGLQEIYKNIDKIICILRSKILYKIKKVSISPSEGPSFSTQEKSRQSRYDREMVESVSVEDVFSCKSQVLERSQEQIGDLKQLILSTLDSFGIAGEIIDYMEGPVLSIVELRLADGTKQSKLLNLQNDLALALKVSAIFISPNPEKSSLSIEIPRKDRQTIHLGSILTNKIFKNSADPLYLALGVCKDGSVFCESLANMPHILIAGSTGSGKSVSLNGLICSIITKASPKEVKMIMIDPKRLELSLYEGIPHLLMPVITETKQAHASLRWVVEEMERRYCLMQASNVRNVGSFNEKSEEDKKLSYIVVIIDELADLMMSSAKEIESLIQKLAQKSRACGIHLILATQRPSVDVITGLIKANLPYRISFRVVSSHDSRTIIDQIGAEKLLGYGDMLMLRPGQSKPLRLHAPYVSDDEVIQLAKRFSVNETCYDEEAMEWIEDNSRDGDGGELDVGQEEDSKFREAVAIAQARGEISTSLLQRYLKVGYNRAARMVELMEKKQLLSEQEGVRPRKWLGGKK
jgi:DNA segregation ATPase FtsK/SpoIIIE, S-DNA-T family